MCQKVFSLKYYVCGAAEQHDDITGRHCRISWTQWKVDLFGIKGRKSGSQNNTTVFLLDKTIHPYSATDQVVECDKTLLIISKVSTSHILKLESSVTIKIHFVAEVEDLSGLSHHDSRCLLSYAPKTGTFLCAVTFCCAPWCWRIEVQ